MKKYFVLALALVVFAVAPAFSQAKVSGEFRYGGYWDTDAEAYTGSIDRTRFNVDAAIDDYNKIHTQLRGEDGDKISAFNLYRVHVMTDWSKYFGFADMGFGLVTSFGQYAYGTNDALSYTIYDDGGTGFELSRRAAMKVDMDIMGIVKPYFATTMQGFDDTTVSTTNQGKDVSEFVVGAGVDFAPVWAEVYYMQNGHKDGTAPAKWEGWGDFTGQIFGLEAEYSGEVADGIALKVGAVLEMINAEALDGEWKYGYMVGAGVGAYGAQLDLAIGGMKDYEFGTLDVSATYDILEFLGVQGGMRMAFGDYAKDLTNDESFLGAEFGLYVKPGKVKYGLGYIIANEDAASYVAHDAFAVKDSASTGKGGVYFTAATKF